MPAAVARRCVGGQGCGGERGVDLVRLRVEVRSDARRCGDGGAEGRADEVAGLDVHERGGRGWLQSAGRLRALC